MDESWRKKEIAKIMATTAFVTGEIDKTQKVNSEKPETHSKKASPTAWPSWSRPLGDCGARSQFGRRVGEVR